jgi:uncharacterized protein (TIGR02145 family)
MAGRTSYYGGTVLDDLIFHIDAAKQESYSKKGIRYTQKGDGNILINFADTSKITSEKSPTGSIYGATFSNFVPFHKAPYSKYWHDKKSIEWTTSAGIGTFYGNIEFDGVNNYIDFGSTPEMDGNTDITVSTWFYVNNFRSGVATQGGTMSMIASRYNNLSTNNGWQLYFDNQGVLYFGGGESNALYIYATSSTLLKPANGGPYGNGGWYNAIGTKSGNTWKLYLAETNRSIVDNIIYEDSTIPVLEGTVAAGTGTTKFSTNKLIIGKSGDSSFDYAFDGRIMSLSIYNRALSISEITQNYKSMSKRVFKLVTQCLDCVSHDVTIGTQTWTGCNATVSTYRDGTPIPYVGASASWVALTTGAWCYVNGDPSTEATYGKLYNWYAINNLTNGGIAPVDYHVPTDSEWTTLTDYLGGLTVAGGKMKEAGLCHWLSPNTDATNITGFGVLPNGRRVISGAWYNFGEYATFWTSTAYSLNTTDAWYRLLTKSDGIIKRFTNGKIVGFSVRFIKDVVCTPSCGAWSYTYTAWSAWSTCATGTQTRTRTANGTRTCILTDCSTNIETSSNIESESQACIIPCPDCVAHDVTIGTQIWTGCNLDVATYRNGDPIPEVTDPTAWAALTTGGWCWHNNDSLNGTTYGKLYNWYAVTDIRGLAPIGYHVPTNAEWIVLTDYLGGDLVAGGKMKEEGLCHWIAPNTGATNTSLFTGLPGGYRDNDGTYYNIGGNGSWWSSSVGDISTAPYLFVANIGPNAYNSYNNFKKSGLSVRLIKDPVCTPSCEAWSYTYTAWSAWSTCTAGTQTRTRTANGTRTCILADCSTNIETSSNIESESQSCVIPCLDCVAHDVTIGTQIWTGCNATVSTYNNGDPIPYVDNTASWAALTTGAWCYVNNDPSTEATYGKLYNWYAITDPRGIAPNGYIVPTDADWTTLTTFLGGTSVAGGKMKGLCHWIPTNIDATNTSLFTGLPGGYRDNGGYYNNIGNYGFWGSSTENNTINAWGLVLSHGDGVATRGSLGKKNGLSLRFIKNPCTNCVAHDVTIGTQIWTGCNATVETYEDGTIIPQVTNAGQWASLTTGAWCYYNNDPANAQYGKLYNWYAVAGIHNAASLSNPALRKKLAPTGYHVPSNTEFSTLFTTVGGGTSAGFHLREPGTCHWASTNNAMLNTYGFSALGGGTKDWDNVFRNLKNFGWWWTSQGIGTANAFYYRIDVNGQIMTSTFYSYMGKSVRFIKD